MQTATATATTDRASGDGSRQWWIVAVFLFGVGDVVTTSLGFAHGGVVELHPVAASLFSHGGIAVMIPAKLLVVGSCYLLWTRLPRPQRVGIPVGLATVGIAVTAWNAHVLLRVTVP